LAQANIHFSTSICGHKPGWRAAKVLSSKVQFSKNLARTLSKGNVLAVPVSEVTRMLAEASAGDPKAAEDLLPLVYDELRKLAAARLVGEPGTQTLQPTALVHEAWLRLVGREGAKWQNQGHFFAAAAEAMRRILIDRARHKHAARRQAFVAKVDLDKVDVAIDSDPETLLAIDEALEKLAAQNSQAAELVKLRFFVGLDYVQAAEALGISRRTANRYWSFARAWLFRELSRTAQN
jgi:RNA polymerase sigma factor (TIGR02999 family)